MIAKHRGTAICIKNLSEQKKDSTQLYLPSGESFIIRPGEIAEISKLNQQHDVENLGFRAARTLAKTKHFELWVAEYSLPTLITQNDLMITVTKSEYRRMLLPVFKMFACLQMLRNKNGPFVKNTPLTRTGA